MYHADILSVIDVFTLLKFDSARTLSPAQTYVKLITYLSDRSAQSRGVDI